MKPELKKCAECGRLFSSAGETAQCQSCSADEQVVYRRIEDIVTIEGIKHVSKIAEAAQVSVSTVKRVLAGLPLVASEVENDAICPKCGARPARIGKELCDICMMGVDADLRDMAGQVEREIENRGRRPEARLRDVSVGGALQEKQRRTGRQRFNPVNPNVKGY